MNSSPKRFTFHIDRARDRMEKGEESDEDAQSTIDFYESWSQEQRALEQTPEWQENNMEYDLRRTEWICDKAKISTVYAQNLYAALCNNDFQRNDMLPILKDQRWSCSWRYAGGIIADMREDGDYIDWYCSGINGGDEPDVYLEEQDIKRKAYVPEGVVTDEIRQDLKKLGWLVVEDNDQE